MNINPELVALAQWRLDQLNAEQEKEAFTPPGGGGDPAAGGAPPGAPPAGPADPNGQPVDPAAAGGAPPGIGGGPGGAPPMPGGGGLDPDTVQQMIQQAIMQQGGGMGGGGAGKMKPPKADDATIAMDIFQVKKMLQHLFQTMGIPMPPDILDGPNRDPSTGMPMAPGAPGSTSDPQVTAQNAAQQPQGGGGAAGGGGGGPIPPIQPMEGAGAGGGATKAGEDAALYMGQPSKYAFDARIVSKAAALAAVYKRLQKG